MKKFILTTLVVITTSSRAVAPDLIYEPVKPSFGGNPFNSAHLLAVANAQNDFEQPVIKSKTAETNQQVTENEPIVPNKAIKTTKPVNNSTVVQVPRKKVAKAIQNLALKTLEKVP